MAEQIVNPEKQSQLELRMQALGLLESDLEEKFVLGGGAGGQKINKTSSCVYLKHHPSGLEVKCQQERSRALNRFLARRQLCEKIEEMVQGKACARQQQIEKLRRQKRRRSKRAQQKMLDNKRHNGQVKTNRASVRDSE